MHYLNDNTAYREDEYLIILHKDEFNDKELEETIKLNINGNYYMYQRTEFLGDSASYGRFSSEVLFKKINALKTYIESSDLKVTLNFNKFKEMINEVLSLIDINIFQKKDLMIKEIENLGLIITSNFEKNIKRAKVSIEGDKRIKKSIEFIYWLLKKNTGLNRAERANEVRNFNANNNQSEIYKECKENLSKIDSKVNYEQKMGILGTNDDKITELVISTEIQGNQRITNFGKDKNNSNLSDESSLSSEIENEQIFTETEGDSSENSNMDDIDSDISQKSEPIINKNRMHKLYRRAGTVINGNDSSNISDTKVDKNKYLKLIESYKNFKKTAEAKENISTNHD
ncbi:uncharacterized protein cubi_03498 [Cryptosporidium ubiquitum]|uniref:Uncharacterized protein n=1 Tax=Cryptosporidium ubiquitum TaxID=857276 RepID=A0A1J4ML02_9CRYT|nr:uncharacterized protein cubi_03498 [Cryptosporidium ubiquitum]OII73700.1 hypothetical protein cubi_03498 [Cryptosporidium ubiquitum]